MQVTSLVTMHADSKFHYLLSDQLDSAGITTRATAALYAGCHRECKTVRRTIPRGCIGAG